MDATLFTACVSLGLAVTALLLMAFGWHSRTKRQLSLGHLVEIPAQLEQQVPLAVFTGTYVSTTLAGDLLNRLTIDSLGYKAAATVFIFDDSVVVSRRGARDLWIPAEDILSVETVSGMAGKVVEKNGLVLITWSFNGTPRGHRTKATVRPREKISPHYPREPYGFGSASILCKPLAELISLPNLNSRKYMNDHFGLSE